MIPLSEITADPSICATLGTAAFGRADDPVDHIRNIHRWRVPRFGSLAGCFLPHETPSISGLAGCGIVLLGLMAFSYAPAGHNTNRSGLARTNRECNVNSGTVGGRVGSAEYGQTGRTTRP